MTDLRAQLQEGLGTSYTLERELGRGGMATVFLARDLKHDRPVALKVLHPELAVSLGPERFLREIKLAARLQHPHILTVLDSGETAGRLWFTMPFVEGESLRDRLLRERQLPVEDALRIAREAAQALQYAHGHGVIHRDIKPENLLLTDDGNTLVADFGIARSLGGGSEEKLTETGLVVGTPAYMSPEQAAGDKGLDARTDVYSLAAVLYEMLTGEPPFTGATTQAMLVRRLTEPAPSARSVRANLPESADQAIRKALSPVVADRFGTMAQFGQALAEADRRAGGEADSSAAATVAVPRTGAAVRLSARPPVRLPVAATTLVLGILIGLGVLFAWRRGHGDGVTGARLVAVLPFENIGESSEEYFADGITDAVRGKLTDIPGLEVIAGRSSSEYKNSDKSLAQIARELGVTHLVTAKVRWAKAADGTRRVQVSPELVQVSAGGAPTTKWQQSFDAAMTDVFQVQADVAGRVAQELGVALADSARRELAQRPTANLDAYDLYLRAEAAALGRGYNDPSAVRTAIPLYERALQLDSSFALAWARLSTAKALIYSNAAASREVAAEARQAADRAHALAPRLPATVLARATYLRMVERDPRAAERTLSEFLPQAASEPSVLAALAGLELELGRPEAALDRLHRAVRLDPRSSGVQTALGSALLMLRQYAAADSAFGRSLDLEPRNLFVYQSRAQVQLGLGDVARARAVVAQASAALDPRAVAIYFATYNELYWLLDSAGQALAVSASPAEYDDDVGSWGLAHAQIYAAWGDQARARAYADSARAGFADQLEKVPEDGVTHALLGLSLAYLGRTAEAVRAGRRGAELLPVTRSLAYGVYIQAMLARIYTMAEEPEQAVGALQVVLSHPGEMSRERLRVDPHFAPLRGHPAFERLVGSP